MSKEFSALLIENDNKELNISLRLVLYCHMARVRYDSSRSSCRWLRSGNV